MLRILILCLIASTATAQELLRFQSYTMSFKATGQDWIDEKCDLLLTIDLANDVVQIYSNTHQRYDIIASTKRYVDEDGDNVIDMEAIDMKGTPCRLHLLKRTSGVLQFQVVYTDFRVSDTVFDMITWVYDLKRKR